MWGGVEMCVWDMKVMMDVKLINSYRSGSRHTRANEGKTYILT